MTLRERQNSITIFSDCAAKCLQCAGADFDERECKKIVDCIRIGNDCAAVCFLAIQSIAGESRFAGQVLKLCAEICIACANECEMYPSIEPCRLCADACHKVAAECLSILELN